MFNDKLTHVFDLVNIKKLKSFNTHDGVAYDCDFYIGRTKVTHIQNDGRGGCTDYHFTSTDTKNLFHDFCDTHNLRQHMFDNGWGFLDSVDKVSDEDILSVFVEDTLQDKEIKKVVNRLQKKGIVYGDIEIGEIRSIAWKSPLCDIVKFHRDKIQDEINKLKKELKKNEKILNTNFETLGLKF